MSKQRVPVPEGPPTELAVAAAASASARPTPALSTLAVSLALIAANALAYVFTVLAARTLTPDRYGELAALLGVVLIAVVPANGLQTAGALALAGSRPGMTPRQLHAAGLIMAGAAAALAAAAAPLVALLLHLPDPATALWLAALLVPHTVLGADQGILQGTQRFARLAVITVIFTVANTAGALAGLLAVGTPGGALAGMTAGATVGAVAGWVGCGAPRPARGSRALVGTALLAGTTLLGFVLLSGLDLILVRYWLPAAAAGDYAVGAILTKVVFWLPQGIGMVVLPRLADPADRHRAVPVAVGLVGGLGAALTLGTAAVGAQALPLIGGSAYGSTIGGAAWLFAALGTLLAVTQLLLYSGIAAADRVCGASVWLAVGVEVAVVATLDAGGQASATTIVVTATGVACLLVAVGALRHTRHAGSWGPGVLGSGATRRYHPTTSLRRGRASRLVPAVMAAFVLAGCSSPAEPELPAADELLSRSADAMRSVQSAAIDLTVDPTVTTVPLRTATGTVTADGQAEGSAVIALQDGPPLEYQLIVTDGVLYLKGPTGGFSELPLASAGEIYDPTAILNPDSGAAALLSGAEDGVTQAREEVEGLDSYRVSATFPAPRVATLVPGVAAAVPGVVWLDVTTSRLVRAEMQLPDTEAGKGGPVTVLISDYDAPVTITAPA